MYARSRRKARDSRRPRRSLRAGWQTARCLDRFWGSRRPDRGLRERHEPPLVSERRDALPVEHRQHAGHLRPDPGLPAGLDPAMDGRLLPDQCSLAMLSHLSWRSRRPKLHREGRALLLACAFRADAPSMKLDQVLGDCEPGQLVVLAEAVKDVWQAVGTDPLPDVDHLDPGTSAGGLEANLDSAAVGGELGPVRQKDGEDLAKPPGTGHQRPDP